MSVMVTNHSKDKLCDCVCGSDMIFKVDTVTRVIRGKEIRIHQVPHYECLSCGEKLFDLSTKISSTVVEAYRNGLTDIVYNPQKTRK